MAPLGRREPLVGIARDADAVDWDDFVGRHPDGTIEHLWGWRHIFDGVFRHKSAYLVARQDGVVTGVLPLVLVRSVLFGRFAVSLPFFNYAGILASDPQTASALLTSAQQVCTDFRARHLELRHRTRLCAGLPARQNKVGLALDLPPTPDRLWSGLDRKLRNQVRKAQKEGLVVTSGGPELLEAFYGVFARNMRDLGTPVFPKQLFVETFRAFPRQSRVFLVHQKEQCLAAAVALRFRGTVLVPWASSLKEFRSLCGNTLLYWAMLEASVQEGASTFDFGRSTRGSGAHKFKQQWQATETALETEYSLFDRNDAPGAGVDSPRMQYAIDTWKRLPLRVANVLGPRVVRHVS